MISAAPPVSLQPSAIARQGKGRFAMPSCTSYGLSQDYFHRTVSTHINPTAQALAYGRVALPTFGAFGVEEINGYPVRRQQYLQRVKQYQAQLKPTIDHWETVEWGKDNPSIAIALNNIKFPGWVGIPPALAYLEKGQVKNTPGALAQLFLKLLGNSPLPVSGSMEEALAKVVATQRAINIPAVGHGQRLKKWGASPISLLRHHDTPGMTTTNLWALPLKDKALSMIFTRHFLVIAPNGAIEIYNIPSPQDLKDILQHDRGLKDAKRFTIDYLYYTKNQLEEFLNYPERYTPRPDYPSRWSIQNAILESFPLDYPTHIREGRIKVALSLPGKDGQSVWDVLPSPTPGTPEP